MDESKNVEANLNFIPPDTPVETGSPEQSILTTWQRNPFCDVTFAVIGQIIVGLAMSKDMGYFNDPKHFLDVKFQADIPENVSKFNICRECSFEFKLERILKDLDNIISIMNNKLKKIYEKSSGKLVAGTMRAHASYVAPVVQLTLMWVEKGE